MNDDARLLERLAADPLLRARFHADPSGTARSLGLDRLADELARSGGRRIESLDRRESRSSLAGALLASVAEAIGIVEAGGHLFGADAAQAATLPGWNPDQFGAHGTGGPLTPDDSALLHDSNVQLDAASIGDVSAGRIDPRVVTLLLDLSHGHKLVISAMASDHAEYTTNGSVSNHFYGRAFDIASIDGQPVTPDNAVAKQMAIQLSTLPASIRPSEIGSPWALSGAAYFTDADHQNHLHVGYDAPIAPGWQPPAATDAPQAAASPAPVSADDASDESSDDDQGSDDTTGGGASDATSESDSHDDGDGADGESGGDDDSDSDSDDGSDDDSDAPGEGSNGEDADDGSSDGDNTDNVDNVDNPDTPDSGPGSIGDSGNSGNSGDSGSNAPDSSNDDSDDDGDSDSDDGSDGSSDTSDSGQSTDSGDGSDSSGSSSSADAVPAESAVDAATGVPAYPGDGASREAIARWMAAAAERHGLPAELPVMASLVESGLANLHYGDADSVGFFQMRTSVWNEGPYAGYEQHPELQLKWFLTEAEAVKAQRLREGLPLDEHHYGDWIADIERPAAQYRGRYQLRLDEAREVLALGSTSTPSSGAGNDAQVMRPVKP
jgi:hypothetical protein